MICAVSLIGTSGLATAKPMSQEPVPAPADAKKKPAKRQNPPKAVKTGKKAVKPQPKPAATTQTLDEDVIVNPNRQPRVKNDPQPVPRIDVESTRQPRVTIDPQSTPRVVTVPSPRPTSQVARKPARLPRERQQQLIVEQRERSVQYRQRLYDQERLAQARSQALRQERRMAQYRYQQQYYSALRRQRLAIDNARYYNYDRDPYYYTAPSYRYSRAGTYYQTNRYGADLLRQAVNYGYEQGFRAGDADRQDRWNDGYESGFAYQDANYGYGGRYVDQDTYNHYFREGYRRGYEDGYNQRHEYGHRSNSNTALIVLASVLAGIIVFEAIDD